MARDGASYRSAILTGLKARCPRCGQGALFGAGLVLRENCDRCGLSYAFADSGDGPAVFAIFILGFSCSAVRSWSSSGSVRRCGCTSCCGACSHRAGVRPAARPQGVLIGLQYKHKAGEGQHAVRLR